MSKFLLLLLLMCSIHNAIGQDNKAYKKDIFNLYHPEVDGTKAIDSIVKVAAAENKKVLVQVGGNWCVWCRRLQDAINKDQVLSSMIDQSFVFYHLNYSKENYNANLMKQWNHPEQYGFPVWVVLDGKGVLQKVQPTDQFESGLQYDLQKLRTAVQLLALLQ